MGRGLKGKERKGDVTILIHRPVRNEDFFWIGSGQSVSMEAEEQKANDGFPGKKTGQLGKGARAGSESSINCDWGNAEKGEKGGIAVHKLKEDGGQANVAEREGKRE